MRQVLLPTAVTRDALTEPGHDVVGGWGATIVSDEAELVDAELVEQCDQLRGATTKRSTTGTVPSNSMSPSLLGVRGSTDFSFSVSSAASARRSALGPMCSKLPVSSRRRAGGSV